MTARRNFDPEPIWSQHDGKKKDDEDSDSDSADSDSDKPKDSVLKKKGKKEKII